jgi:MFS family permease
VQLGFVAGTLAAATLNLADLFPSRLYFAVSAVLAAAANGSLLVVDGFGPALALRFATGFTLAGVYPPAMKMASTWFRARRGLAIGVVVGALTVGKAAPFLVEGLGGVRAGLVVAVTSAGALVAAVLVLAGYRDGPHAFPRRPFSWSLAGEAFGDRRVRLATGGYLGHMWELYAFWAWIATYLATARLGGPAAPPVPLLAFAVIAIGALGCVGGGWLADRFGREQLVTASLVVSGACALLSAVVFAGPPALVVVLAAVWGVAVIADSAQFSALVTEVAPPHAVGTALTLQTSLGFLLTTVTIQLVPHLAHAFGWRWAFPVLALGPIVGIAAIARLRRLRATPAGPA